MTTSTPPTEPATAAYSTTHKEYELPINGFTGTPDEIERQWFEKCYKGRGDTMLQLTARAVIMGSILGGLLSVTNIYIGLKAGWSFGVSITACILSYSIWSVIAGISGQVWAVLVSGGLGLAALGGCLLAWHNGKLPLIPALVLGGIGFIGFGALAWLLGRKRTPMTILENNCMQTAASAAGASAGGTLISAFAAHMMLTNEVLDLPILMGLVFFLAILGVTMAVPMKRQMINAEQLKFPSGVAAAETLKALHGAAGGGMGSAIALGASGLLAVLDKLYLDGLHLFSSALQRFELGNLVARFNQAVFGPVWIGRTVTLSWEPMFIAAGAITGIRVCTSMLIGGITCWIIYIPVIQGLSGGKGQPLLTMTPTFRQAVDWSLWGGTACMVTSGLLAFGLQWKSALRAFSGMAKMLGSQKATKHDPRREEIDSIETPAWWFIGGQAVGFAGLAWLGALAFHIPVWQTAVAVVMSFALALVACRVTGETDTTPIGALGKVTQLTFGLIAPGKAIMNLMAANVTAGSAGSSATLLTDLKSGYLLGAHPRKQFLAQFSGIFIGTVVTVLIFRALVPDASVLGSEQFPAPAAQVWKAVAIALSEGISKMHPIKIWGMAIGGAIGLILPLIGMAVPAKVKPWIPSAAGVGFGWVFQFYYGALFFVGGVVSLILEKVAPKWSGKYLFSIASGWIAGEALMGAGIPLIENGPEIVKKLFMGG